MSEVNEPWWKEYRRNQYKPRKVLSMEMIIRKSSKDTMKDYLNNCSFAGINNFTADYSTFGVKYTLLRLLVFSAVIVALGYCLSYVYSNMSKPLVVSLESSTYPISEIDFPAVALCSINRVSKSKVEELTERLVSSHRFGADSHRIGRWLFREHGRLLDFEYDESVQTIVSHLDGNYKYGRSHKVKEVMALLAPNCSEMLIRCSWKGRNYPCDELFTLRRTIRGHCCTFNYLWSWDSKHGKMIDGGEAYRQDKHGLSNGLVVIMDPKINDQAYSVLPMKGVEVLLFDPWQYPDFSSGRVNHRFLEPNKANLLEISSRRQYATNEVRKYTPKTRNCMFYDEGPEVYGKVYSMSSCLLLCRIAAIEALCHCVPYFLPAPEGHPMCTLEDLYCLNKHKEKLLYLRPKNPETWSGLHQEYRDSTSCPQCYPDCEHTQHLTSANSIFLQRGDGHSAKYSTHSALRGVNLTDKCVLAVFQATADGTLNRLDVVYYWYELLSNVGGFGGVLLGFCLLCIVEMLYFLSIRFFYQFHDNYVKYHH